MMRQVAVGFRFNGTLKKLFSIITEPSKKTGAFKIFSAVFYGGFFAFNQEIEENWRILAVFCGLQF